MGQWLRWSPGGDRACGPLYHPADLQALTDGTIDRNPMTGIRKPRTVALDRETKRPVLTNVLKSPSAMRGGTLPDDVLAQLKIHRSRQLQQRMKAGAIWHDHNLIFPSRAIQRHFQQH